MTLSVSINAFHSDRVFVFVFFFEVSDLYLAENHLAIGFGIYNHGVRLLHKFINQLIFFL